MGKGKESYWKTAPFIPHIIQHWCIPKSQESLNANFLFVKNSIYYIFLLINFHILLYDEFRALFRGLVAFCKKKLVAFMTLSQNLTNNFELIFWLMTQKSPVLVAFNVWIVKLRITTTTTTKLLKKHLLWKILLIYVINFAQTRNSHTFLICQNVAFRIAASKLNCKMMPRNPN
jgi:hypothetical protein